MNHLEFMAWCMDHIQAESIEQRAKLYRAMADLVGDASESKKLLHMAAGCEDVLNDHTQLSLKFKGTLIPRPL